MYKCETCNYVTEKEHNYLRHENTATHLQKVHDYKLSVEKKKLQCICGKQYKHRSSFNYHKKKYNCANKLSDNILPDKVFPDSNNMNAKSLKEASDLINDITNRSLEQKGNIILNINNISVNNSNTTTNN